MARKSRKHSKKGRRRGRSVTVRGSGRRGKSRSMTIRINPRRRRRHFRSNPGGGFLRQTIHIFKRGAAVEGGRITLGLAESFVPAKWNVGAMGTVVSIGLAGLIAVAAKKALGPGIGEDIGVGAATRVIDRMIVTFIPAVAKKTGLAGYVPLNGYVPLSAGRDPDEYQAGIADAQGMGWGVEMGN